MLVAQFTCGAKPILNRPVFGATPRGPAEVGHEQSRSRVVVTMRARKRRKGGSEKEKKEKEKKERG